MTAEDQGTMVEPRVVGGSVPFTLFVREASKNIRAAPLLTLVAVLTIAVSLVLVGLFGFVLVNASQLLDAIESDLTVAVELEEDVTPQTVTAMVNAIKARDEVASVEVLDALQDRQRTMEALPNDVLEGLDEEAIPGRPMLEIRFRTDGRRKDDFTVLPDWLETLEGTASVQRLHFDAHKVRVVFAVIDIIRLMGFIVCGILLAAAVFFTVSTIKLAVYARQEEIEVLRLVGATDRFIRMPFYLEGIFAGGMGSVTALSIVAVIHGRLSSYVDEQVFIDVDLHLMPAGMVLWLLLGGVVLGLLGARLSVQRYLRR